SVPLAGAPGASAALTVTFDPSATERRALVLTLRDAAIVCATLIAQSRAADEARRLSAQRERALHVVSHELRNLLTVLDGNASLLLASDGRRAPAERIQRTTARMKRLVADLLDVPS